MRWIWVTKIFPSLKKVISLNTNSYQCMTWREKTRDYDCEPVSEASRGCHETSLPLYCLLLQRVGHGLEPENDGYEENWYLYWKCCLPGVDLVQTVPFPVIGGHLNLLWVPRSELSQGLKKASYLENRVPLSRGPGLPGCWKAPGKSTLSYDLIHLGRSHFIQGKTIINITSQDPIIIINWTPSKSSE